MTILAFAAASRTDCSAPFFCRREGRVDEGFTEIDFAPVPQIFGELLYNRSRRPERCQSRKRNGRFDKQIAPRGDPPMARRCGAPKGPRSRRRASPSRAGRTHRDADAAKGSSGPGVRLLTMGMHQSAGTL